MGRDALKEPRQKASGESFGDLMVQVSLLAGINPSTLAVLQKGCTRKKFRHDDRIFYRGDPADYFYVLLSGEVNLVLTSPDGRELIINEMRHGDFFGELGLLIGEARSADAVVRQAADLLIIPGRSFMEALDCDHQLTHRLLVATALRLNRTSDFQNALAFLDAQARLARVLLDLDGQNVDLGYITISQEELAQRSGLIRQTVAKTLGLWRRNGWLLTGRGHIMLLNRNALRLWFKEKGG
jgi:CRP/FNR family transcriptional regulator, cyclic AMP receptor protein